MAILFRTSTTVLWCTSSAAKHPAQYIQCATPSPPLPTGCEVFEELTACVCSITVSLKRGCADLRRAPVSEYTANKRRAALSRARLRWIALVVWCKRPPERGQEGAVVLFVVVGCHVLTPMMSDVNGCDECFVQGVVCIEAGQRERA